MAGKDAGAPSRPLSETAAKPAPQDLTSPTLLSHRPPIPRERRGTAARREGGGALSRGMGGRWERVGVRFPGRGTRLRTVNTPLNHLQTISVCPSRHVL